MEKLTKAFEQYLLSLNITVAKIDASLISEKLPLFVSAPYAFYTASVMNQEYMLIIAKNEESPEPKQIILQQKAIEAASCMPCIFVFENITKEMCTILIGKKIAFVIPKKQCYLPGNIVSICEKKFSSPESKKREKLSPLAQMALIHYLLGNGENGVISFQDLIATFSLKKVYVSRTASELKAFRLAEIISIGRNKMLNFDLNRKALWQKAQAYLTNPIKKKIRIKNCPAGLPKAGVSALSAYSNLNDDSVKTYAVYHRFFDIKNTEVFKYEGEYLELWKYQTLAACNGIVDRFSLYLSMKDDPDPRVQSALSDMMEAIWVEE